MDLCIEKSRKSENESKADKNIDLKGSRTIRLKRACERAKIRLSNFDITKIHVNNYSDYESVDVYITRDEFFGYCGNLFEYFRFILDNFVVRSGAEKNNISEVILIGGSTLIPNIKDIITNKFNKSIIKCDLNPKEIVTMGASIRGAKFNNLPLVKNISIFEIMNLSIGIQDYQNKFLKIIERGNPIPCENKKIILLLKMIKQRIRYQFMKEKIIISAIKIIYY